MGLLNTRLSKLFGERFYKYPKGSTLPEFRKKLKKIGFRYGKYPSIISFCQLHPKKTRDLILESYKKISGEDQLSLYDKSIYIFCLFSKENADLFDVMKEELEKYSL